MTKTKGTEGQVHCPKFWDGVPVPLSPKKDGPKPLRLQTIFLMLCRINFSIIVE